MPIARTILSLVAGAAAAGAVLAGPAAAAVDLPCSTAKLIVPWNPGGDTDIVMRAVTDAANRAGAEPRLQVVNVGGQGGTKGASQVRGARPDGCTLAALHDSILTSFLTGRIDYTWDAFEPVALMSYTPSIIGTAKTAPFATLKEMIAKAKKEPKSITTGATLGSTTHFFFVLIEDRAGIRVKYVPYEGTRDRITALLAGNIAMGEMNIITAQRYMKDDALDALGIASDKRDPLLPDLPTLKEQGVDLVYGTNRGIFLPKGTPEEVVAHWEGILKKASQDPEFVKALTTQGTQVRYLSSADYGAFMAKALADNKKAAVNVGLIKK